MNSISQNRFDFIENVVALMLMLRALREILTTRAAIPEKPHERFAHLRQPKCQGDMR